MPDDELDSLDNIDTGLLSGQLESYSGRTDTETLGTASMPIFSPDDLEPNGLNMPPSALRSSICFNDFQDGTLWDDQYDTILGNLIGFSDAEFSFNAPVGRAEPDDDKAGHDTMGGSSTRAPSASESRVHGSAPAATEKRDKRVHALSRLNLNLSEQVQSVQCRTERSLVCHALQSSEELLGILDGFPTTSASSSVDDGTMALDAAQTLLILSCYINMVRIFGAVCGTLLKGGDDSRGAKAVPLRLENIPIQNRGLQVALVLQTMTYMLDRVEKVLAATYEEAGEGAVTLAGVVQTTLRLEGVKSTIAALRHDMRRIQQQIGLDFSANVPEGPSPSLPMA